MEWRRVAKRRKTTHVVPLGGEEGGYPSLNEENLCVFREYFDVNKGICHADFLIRKDREDLCLYCVKTLIN